ncbi:MAG TPA: hypothetical protein VF319_04315 [Caldimonas sp.]
MRYFICNTPSAYAVISVLHRPVESATLTGHSDFSTDMPKAAGRGVTMRRVARSGNVRRETCRQILRATVFMGRQLNLVYCAVGRNNIDWN